MCTYHDKAKETTIESSSILDHFPKVESSEILNIWWWEKWSITLTNAYKYVSYVGWEYLTIAKVESDFTDEYDCIAMIMKMMFMDLNIQESG